MSLTPLVPFLAVGLILSVTGMVHGAGRNDANFTALCAICFIASVVVAALFINANAWRKSEASEKASATASSVRRNARLAGLLYTWGAAALFAIYSLSDLTWRHSWQYGLGMAIIGIGIFIYVYRLGASKPSALPPLYLTVLHGLAAVSGLTYLIGTGKLQTVKSDWAANEVFLWGGFGIVVLCILSLITQVLHTRARRDVGNLS